MTILRGKIVLASGPVITHHTAESLRDRPVQDFALLLQDHDTIIVDPAVAIRGPIGRLVARLLGTAWVVAFRALRAARDGRVIIAAGDDVGVPIAALKHVMCRRVPLVLQCQHMRTNKAKLLMGKLKVQRTVQLFYALSIAQRDMLLTTYGIPAAKIEFGYTPVDPDFFRPDSAIDVRRQIVSAGTAERDYATLMRATKGLDVDVKIEANSAWYAEPQNFSDADVHERVELCNDGTTKGLRAMYAASQLVVVPLIENDHPAGYTVMVEGMAMAKPVIASDIKYVGDFITHGRTGFLVPPGDPAALRAQIESLLEQPELCREIGEAARREVLARFTMEHFRGRMAAAIERFGQP